MHLARVARAALIVALAAALMLPAGAALAGTPTADRYAGENRFDTAAQIALDTFPDGADTVVIARADDHADALAGAYVAGVLDAPILLAPRHRFPLAPKDHIVLDGEFPTIKALDQLDPGLIVLLGGTAALGEWVEFGLNDRYSVVGNPDTRVVRVSGSDRYETARLAAAVATAEAGLPAPLVGTAGAIHPEHDSVPTAILATGQNFPDAMSAGPLAYRNHYPLVLTPGGSLSPHAEALLTDPDFGIGAVIIPGGQAAVSASVASQVEALGIDVIRLAGADRADTAALTASAALLLGFDFAEVNLATGRSFADAVAVAPRAGRTGSVLLLTGDPLSPPTADYLAFWCDEIEHIQIAGGRAAISTAVAVQAGVAATCP